MTNIHGYWEPVKQVIDGETLASKGRLFNPAGKGTPELENDKEAVCGYTQVIRTRYDISVSIPGGKGDFSIIESRIFSRTRELYKKPTCFDVSHGLRVHNVDDDSLPKNYPSGWHILEQIRYEDNSMPLPLLGLEIYVGDFVGNDGVDEVAIKYPNGDLKVYQWRQGVLNNEGN
jgi:hypothetical protein